MKIRISLAGIPMEIDSVFDSFYNFCKDYITDEEPLFSVSVTRDDLKREYEFCETGDMPYGKSYDTEYEKTAIYRKIAEKIIDYDGMVFHGSAVAVGDNAYIFAAKSGTGKTTHTRFWLKNIENSYVVNGDKPILRIIDGEPFVCGTPWMGKEHFGCNKMVKIKSICILERCKSNSAERVSFSDVMPNLINQTYRPVKTSDIVKTVKLIEKISKSVDLYKIFCNMNNDAARTVYEKIK